MIYNPQVGMRVRYTDQNGHTLWLDKVGSIEYIVPHSDATYDDKYIIVGVIFDGESSSRDFYCFRLSYLDPNEEREERERFEDQNAEKIMPINIYEIL